MRATAVITTQWEGKGYSSVQTDHIESFSVDGAMDTDTDQWVLTVGDPDAEFVDTLKRDNEVRVNIYGVGGSQVEALHTGFADQITLDERGLLQFAGRDISSVAVDSQHPPQIWRAIRPEVLVAREARDLKIGDALKLSKADGFKTFATDGSESYWQVWYRFYRKRRMWMWAESDGSLNAATLNYTQKPSYYFGTAMAISGVTANDWLPVERLEYTANKNQRIGEVFYFGHRGDVGFVAKAVDPSTVKWIRKPNVIITSSDVHNAAEARVEAWEEIFESKVGANEIKVLVADPGFVIRQNRMAVLNFPSIGLRGTYFVVGTNIVGSIGEGFYQQVRLREKNYAISRRVPTSPQLNGNVGTTTAGGVAENLSGDINYKSAFVEAAEKFRGPWSFELFLGVLLSIGQKESSFQNKREGGHVIYPGSAGTAPHNKGSEAAEFNRFASLYANEARYGRVTQDYGVGPMQLTTRGYKLYADRLDPSSTIGDELYGGRWNPRCNILAGAAAFASKLGAGVSISSDGRLVKVAPSGLSLQPTEENIWQGVQDYNGSGDAAVAYRKDVKNIYTTTYKAEVADAVVQTRQDQKNQKVNTNFGTSAELRKRVLNNSEITFTRSSQSSDITFGLVHDEVLIFMLAFVNAGFKIVVTAMRSDHDKYTTAGNISAHGKGLAVDMGNYGLSNPLTRAAMLWIGEHADQLGLAQLIGPVDALVIPPGLYNADTLAQHDNHIHVGWPLSLAN